jgi:hypothetical protein
MKGIPPWLEVPRPRARASGAELANRCLCQTGPVTPTQYKAIRERVSQVEPDLVLAADETDGDLTDCR